jgi:coatomer subunit beta'
MYRCLGMKDAMRGLADKALEAGKMNLAFQAAFFAGEAETCRQVLLKAKRYPEAALFSRTYLPSKVDDSLATWKRELGEVARHLTTEEEVEEDDE